MNIKIITAVILATLVADASAWGSYSGSRYNAPAQTYGNRYGNDSNSYQLYSPKGKYMGNLNDNRYDSNSISNPYGRYGNPYSQDSINNPYRGDADWP